MKKCFVLIMAMMAFMMTNCKPDPIEPSGNDHPEGVEELKTPEVVSKVVINPNGFNTLFVQLHNPNGIAIDLNFDVEFYKDGQMIGSAEDLYYISLPKNDDCMIWSNWEIPADPDEIKITNWEFDVAYYQPVEMAITKEEVGPDYVDLGFRTEKDFQFEAGVNLVYYKNNEIIGLCSKCFLPGDNLEYAFEIFDGYDSYKIFARAY